MFSLHLRFEHFKNEKTFIYHRDGANAIANDT